MFLILLHCTETTSEMHMRYSKISFALGVDKYENQLTQLHFTFHVEEVQKKKFPLRKQIKQHNLT